MKDQTSELRTLSHSLDKQYHQLKSELDQWHSNTIERIEEMYLNTLIELDTSYERLDTFRQTLYVLLDDERLMNLIPLTSSNLLQFSTRLSWLENEIDSISNLFFHLNCQQVKFTDRPYLIHTNPLTTSPCRILIKCEQINQLPDSMNNTLYTLVTYPTSPEAILMTMNVEQLSLIFDSIFFQTNELRILIHEYYAPFIIGQLGSRAKLLKEKYFLTNMKIYPTSAPLSTERILLLSGKKFEQILQCLKEIYLNISQIPIQQTTTFLYSPEYYDSSLADDYGGYMDRPIQRSINQIYTNDEEELSGYEDEVVEDFDNDTNNYQTEILEPLRERHWTLSDAQAGALFGPNSSRLHQIRSESNAWIVIYEAEGKSTRRPMSIRGTKSEIEHATKLILETIKRHDRKLPIRHTHKRGK